MIARGRVENGVVVLMDGIRLSEGELVTVVVSPKTSPELAATQPNREHAVTPVSNERREALLALIGLCKTDNPPDDEEVERIIEEYRMKKYG